MLERYIMVSWPEIQDYMEHSRWEECIFCQEIEGHPCPENSYMVPESLYEEIQLKDLDDWVIYNNHMYYYDKPIIKGSKVLFAKGEEMFEDTCIAAPEGLPYLFENGTLPGIGGIEIVAVR
jgi:hypothetical protein